MVREAEAAGFNPLTALRNGGAAGFSTSTTTVPGLSGGEIIGQGLSQFANNVGNFLADFDPMADQKKEAEYQLVQAQIKNLNASSSAMERQALGAPGSFNVPQYGAGSTERRPSGTAGQLSGVTLNDGFTYRGTGDGGEVEDMWVAMRLPDGTHVRVPNPKLPDADQYVVPPAAVLDRSIDPQVKGGPDPAAAKVKSDFSEWWNEWTKPWRENVMP